jgi:predicted nucleotidyltransferase
MTLGAISSTDPRLVDYCWRWRVRELAVFGSAPRGALRPDSDIDVLVSFEDDVPWDLADVLSAKLELGQLLGRPVDMVERSAIEADENWLLRAEALGSARVVHARP